MSNPATTPTSSATTVNIQVKEPKRANFKDIIEAAKREYGSSSKEVKILEAFFDWVENTANPKVRKMVNSLGNNTAPYFEAFNEAVREACGNPNDPQRASFKKIIDKAIAKYGPNSKEGRILKQFKTWLEKIANPKVRRLINSLGNQTASYFKAFGETVFNACGYQVFDLPTITSSSPTTVNRGETTLTIQGERFPSKAKVEFLDGEEKPDPSIKTDTPSVASDGKSITVKITVPTEAKEGKRNIRVSSEEYSQLAAVLPDGLEIGPAPKILEIEPPYIFANGEPQSITIKVENLPASELKLDIVDKSEKSIIEEGEKTITAKQIHSMDDSNITFIGTPSQLDTADKADKADKEKQETKTDEEQRVCVTIPKTTAKGTYFLVLRDHNGTEIVRKEVNVVKIKIPESWLSINLRKALNSKTVALLNPELTVEAGISNFGLQEDEMTGTGPLTQNYPRGDFEQIPNWDITLRLNPRLHLLGGGKIEAESFTDLVEEKQGKVMDALQKAGYINSDGTLQSKFDGNRDNFSLDGVDLTPEELTYVFDVLQEKSGKLQLDPEVHASWQKFHNLGDAKGTNQLNVGVGISASTSTLIQLMQLVPRLNLFYDYYRNAEQDPSLAHPAGSEHAFTSSLQLAWKPLRLFMDPKHSWLVARLGLAHQASWFHYWKETLGFPFDGRSQRLVLNGGLDLNFSELSSHWLIPNLSLNGAGILSGYRDVPDSLVDKWQKDLTGWSVDGKLQFPRLWNAYLAGGYRRETAGGHIELFHRRASVGLTPPGLGTFILSSGYTRNNPYYLTSRGYAELTWLPPESLWYLPQLTVGGGLLRDEEAGRTFPNVYGQAKYNVIDLIKKIVE